MSTIKNGLPTSLTSALLKEILRYEPRHWKAIKPKLARKNPTIWKSLNLSDNGFYDKLHENLKDPIIRRDFDTVATRQDTKRRKCGLLSGIHHFYSNQLADEESFQERLPERASPRQLIDAIAYCEDDDRLTNVVWALLEEGTISRDEIAEIAEKHSGVLDRLAPVFHAGAADAVTITDRWEKCLSRIKKTLDDADSRDPDSRIVQLLTKDVEKLSELVVEAETSHGFSMSVVKLIRDYKDILSERTSLKPLVDKVLESPFSLQVPADEPLFLDEIERSLRLLADVVKDILEKSTAISKADAEERGELGKEIGLLSASQEKTYANIEALLLQAICVGDTNMIADGSDHESEVLADDKLEHIPESVVTSRETEGSASVDSEKSVKDLSSDSDVDDSDNELLDTSGSSTDDEATSRKDESIVEETEEPSSLVETDAIEESVKSELEAAEQDNSLDSSDPAPSRSIETAPSADKSKQRDSSPSASEALEAMLSTGRFARAYWLTRADSTLGDSDLFGALSEGTRIGPGDSCPGGLNQFFNCLARRDHWQDDERHLLSASILGACLFVDPLPQDIYQLARELPPGGSPVGSLMQRVRDLCVHQNAKIRPQDLGGESADDARSVRLDRLVNDAESFLHRVPHIRFQYAPADIAIQFLYRAGSEWHRIHTIIGRSQSRRLNEVQVLTGQLNPIEVVANLHDQDELSILKQPLQGRARDKLVRHLHDTLALAKEWSRLVATSKVGSQNANRTQPEELLGALNKLLPAARRALSPIKGRGAVDALDSVLADLEIRIQGNEPAERACIATDLLLLPDLTLEDDLEPADSQHHQLQRAILEAERSETEPSTVFKECLSHQEYRRARVIMEVHQLGERAKTEYRQSVSRKRSSLKDAMDELRLEIEDAFLLGQLRDDAETTSAAEDQTHNALERSQLLAVIRDAEEKLSRSADTDADELRAISRRIEEVTAKAKEMTSKRRERLLRDFSAMMEQLPQTEQGEADRVYLKDAFGDCMKSDDHVAAFDLLDRGRRATQRMEPVARASTGSSEKIELFLQRADGYRDELSRRDWLTRVKNSLHKGSTFLQIAFGQLDRARRDEATNALQTWSALTRLRFASAHRGLTESMETLLRFLGLPLQTGGIEIAETSQDGFAHFRATLTRPVTSSPLPAFGSVCGTTYEIVVSQKRKEPEQIEEYVRSRGLAGRPVLALLLLPHSSNFRIRWQRYFARARLTVLPLDLVIFLHLCGERNRLPTLFELGLPFTWTRPYITKGENVATEMFVGRNDETTALLDPDGSCIVFGGRQLGKSALLRHVHREHHRPDRSVYVVYLDVDDLGTDSQGHDAMAAVFWCRVYDELVRWDAIPKLPQKVLSKANRMVDEVPNSVATRLSADDEVRVLLLLDETDDLLDCDSGQDFALVRRLRSLMASTERRFKVVFAGLQSVQRYYSWKNHPFAQLGEELVVNPLPPAAAQELIIRPLRALGFAFDNTGLVLRILSQTNYHPGLIQIFGYRLLDSLFNKWQRQEGSGPIRRISSEDLLAVERDRSVMEDIRNRFDWTLDLDDRYKVLTYALVLTPDPTAHRLESEFMAIGTEWWPVIFEEMDTQGLRAVLDEMVGLGVLLREHNDAARTYRLRSPNLLRLLGPQEAIEVELLRIIERDRISRLNPRNFHPRIDQKPVTFGPLTMEQEGQLDGYQRPFQLTLVSGSEALGLSDVARQFDRLLSDPRDDTRNRTWRKVSLDGRRRANALVKKLRDSLKPRHRTHRYAIVRLRDIEYDGELSVLFNQLVRELGQVCTNESRGHLILLLDPTETWQWIRDRNRERVLSQPRVTGLELRRWSDGAITNAFDRLEARTGSQLAGGEVFELTSGFHFLVNQGLTRVRSRSATNARTLVEIWETLRGETLTDGETDSVMLTIGLRGIDTRLEKSVWEVFRLREPLNGRSVLTDTSFELATEVLESSDQQWFEANAVHIREWIQMMGLAHPSDSRKENSMVVPALVRDVIKAKGG